LITSISTTRFVNRHGEIIHIYSLYSPKNSIQTLINACIRSEGNELSLYQKWGTYFQFQFGNFSASPPATNLNLYSYISGRTDARSSSMPSDCFDLLGNIKGISCSAVYMYVLCIYKHINPRIRRLHSYYFAEMKPLPC
jgi:hypothetical protein